MSVLLTAARSLKPAGRFPWPSALRLPLSVFCPLLAALLAFPAHAGDLLSGRIFAVPDKLYVNQAFEIRFDLEVTPGCEIEDLRVSDFPNNPDLIAVGRLENASRERITRESQSIDVLHFVATARCFKPIAHTFNPAVQCMIVERRNVGFFSHWQSFPKQQKLAPFTLNVRPLPDAGRPAEFSGAVGTFRLTGTLSQNTVQPGDIITLNLDLSGQGWLGDNAAMPRPADSPLFKIYPAKDLAREPLHLQTAQVFIPQSTNATEIAAARFCYFNPATDRYEVSAAGPFRLTFSSAAQAPKTNEVRVIDTASRIVTAADAATQTVASIDRMNMTLRQAVPLLTACVGTLAAFFVFFLLYGRHKRLAFAAGIVLLGLGLGAGRALSGKTATAAQTLARRTEVLFAPSHAAATLFTVNPGEPVIPIERADAWVRIDASGRRGWIPAANIAARAADKPQQAR